MADQKSWLDAVLKRKSYNESPIQVIALQESNDVVGKGENYLSKIVRVKATVMLGSGKTKQISLIIKNEHETEQMKKFSQNMGVFFREITMYRDVLPKMEDLLDEVNDSDDIPWGRCYDYRLYDRIVFEDLGAIGYKMADRKKQLGLKSALLVVKSLAKFHALSKILLDRGEIPMDVFGKHIWSKNPEMTIKMTNDNGERLLKAMRAWGDEWQDSADRFEKALPDLGRLFVEALDTKPDEFTVLCHGDCWTNNMLFKGDLEDPTSVKFLDLQISSMGTPARDLYYFMLSSVRLEVRKQHNDLILQTYIDTLKCQLLRLQYEGFILDMVALKEDLKERQILSLENAIGIVPIVTGETRDFPEMEEFAKAMAEENGSKRIEELMSEADIFTVTTKNIIYDVIGTAMDSGFI